MGLMSDNEPWPEVEGASMTPQEKGLRPSLRLSHPSRPSGAQAVIPGSPVSFVPWKT